MAKTLSSASSITLSSGTIGANSSWFQSTGLIDCSEIHGLNVELKATFADNAAVAGNLTFYMIGSNDSGTDITSEQQATPIAVMTPIQNTTITTVVEVPLLYADQVGFGIKNEDSTYSVDITCSYKTVTF